MLIGMLLAALAFYVIVRVAVRHGIEDATRRGPADAGGSRVESPLLDDLREAWHRILGAFGWLG
jgi:hypothetical protein